MCESFQTHLESDDSESYLAYVAEHELQRWLQPWEVQDSVLRDFNKLNAGTDPYWAISSGSGNHKHYGCVL